MLPVSQDCPFKFQVEISELTVEKKKLAWSRKSFDQQKYK